MYVYIGIPKNNLKFMIDVPLAQNSAGQRPPGTKGLPVKVAPSGALAAAGMARAARVAAAVRAAAERGR